MLKATNDTQYQGIVFVLPADYMVKKCSYVCFETVL